MFEKYCLLTSKSLKEDVSEEQIAKINLKLKHQIFSYTFYKGFRYLIFMHFHRATIVITLLLAILSKSLFSFGYIISCLILVHENPKFFTKD